MECLFTYFKVAVMDALKSPAVVLGTVPAKARGFIEKTKKRSDVRIIEVTREDRDALPGRLCRSIGSLFNI
jgi:nucleoside-triphosphatase THEP1